MYELMPFGKYKNQPLADVPGSYLQWLLDNADLYESTREAVEAEVRSRRFRDQLLGESTVPTVPCVPDEHRAVLEQALEAGFYMLAKRTEKGSVARKKLLATRRWALRELLQKEERM